jgi:uncharacterized protein
VIKSRVGAGLVGLIILWLPSAMAAYPLRTGSISDLANVLPNRDETALLESIAWFKRNTGGEIMVLTLASWKALATPDKTWESFNTNLFNRWGIGSKSRNDGVLFVAAIKERKLRIELGLGFKRCYDFSMKQILERDVVPLFKETRYGAGMALGTKKIIQSLPKLCPVAPKPVTVPNANLTRPSIQTYVPSSPSIPEPITPWLPIGVGLTILGAWAGIGSLSRPKRCQQCKTPLEKISEEADDEYLNQGQQLEERLQSVNYDVWHCKTCNNHELFRRRAFFSSYSQCPSCQHQTLSGTQKPIVPASETQQGLARLERTCSHCQHRDSQDILLPRLSRDENRPRFYPTNFSNQSNSDRDSRVNSNNSSSSGGQSGGGGASADW